jgi:uncharacterized membrane protein
VSESRRAWLLTMLRVTAGVLAVGYPLLMYFGLSRFGTRSAAWMLLVVAVAHTVIRSRQLRAFAWRSALCVPLCAGALWLDDRRYMLAVPVLINAGFFITFFGSLRGPMPLVERFARMRVRELSPEEQVYCRSVTKVWSAFFLFNGATAALLALSGSLALWTLYTGLISYVLVGVLGASEYTLRKYRFGRYGNGLHDRMLQALLTAPRARSTRSTPP